MSSKHPQGPHHHEIVHLQAALAIQFSTDSFALPAPYTHTFTSYDWTSPSEIAPRISTATIIITNIARLTAEILSPAVTPNLQMIAVVAAGTDCVDLEAARKRGLVVCNVPAASTESVAEHAVALYFAVRRRVAELDQLVRGGEWVKKGGTLKGTFLGSYPRTCKLEVVGIVGYGSLGKRIEELVKGLGMSTLVAARKGSTAAPPPGRSSFLDVLAKASVLILCCPLTAETTNYISALELQAMQRDAIVLNVARGGIVNEEALAKALKEGWIGGAGTDVFEKEPATAAGETRSVLLEEGVPNLVVTPHLAWYAESTVVKLKGTVVSNVEAWVRGEVQNAVVGGDGEL